MPKVQKYDEDGLRLQTYERNRGEIRPLEKDDASAILNLCIDSMKNHGGRPATYPNTEKGLADFREMSLKYLEHVQRVNSNDDMERQLILDYESWAVYCGVCRQTVWLYEKRGGEWSAFIRYMREVITATKKQLMMTYKIILANLLLHGHGDALEYWITCSRWTISIKNVPSSWDILA